MQFKSMQSKVKHPIKVLYVAISVFVLFSCDSSQSEQNTEDEQSVVTAVREEVLTNESSDDIEFSYIDSVTGEKRLENEQSVVTVVNEEVLTNESSADIEFSYIDSVTGDERIIESIDSTDLNNTNRLDESENDVPEGYKRLESGGIMLDAPIMGMEWESVEDLNTSRTPRIYQPFTIMECLTEDSEHLRLDVVNSDIGYMLMFYFSSRYDDRATLQAQLSTQDSYFSNNLNSTMLVMRDPMHYYEFVDFDNDDISLEVIDTLRGREINRFFCDDSSANWEEGDSFSVINQMNPEKFGFIPVTDDLLEVLNERFDKYYD